MAVSYTKPAQRDLRRLNPTDVATIVAAIEHLDATGIGDVVKLHGLTPARWRLRVGRFRVIYRPDNVTLWVERVGDRRDVYRA